MQRGVVQKVLSVEQAEGRGARVRRSIGRKELRRLDPFLLLDEFRVRQPAGFPDHPHRGFETVTYMLKGSFHHQDFCGHSGVIRKGDLQWMTAGRGVVHSEMPASDGDNIGLQLWINLPASQKMIEPVYQELLASQVPSATSGGTTVKVIAGESMGVESPVRTRTPVYYLDFQQEPGAKFTQEVPRDWNAFIYVLTGTISVVVDEEESESGPHHTLVLSQGDSVKVCNTGPDTAHFVLIAGQPIGEPVVQDGPFVMNTREEIRQTLQDYSDAKNGFENARNWKSA
ncbi:pirin [Procambarus clarkii]|uniref:pirin n=1 Tax=Procambarus clarkii TaxID=6728 RepID=UPI001E672BDD|nr:pirin-like [Procambarus clarkii]XP_045595985.1 pirin-like [Procambarus clarkii]